MERRHAEAVAEGLREELSAAEKALVGKPAMDLEFQGVRTELQGIKADIRTARAELEAKIEARNTELFRNLVLLQVGVAGLIVALLKLLP